MNLQHQNTAAQSQKVVSAYFTSEQILPFCFVEHARLKLFVKYIIIKVFRDHESSQVSTLTSIAMYRCWYFRDMWTDLAHSSTQSHWWTKSADKIDKIGGWTQISYQIQCQGQHGTAQIHGYSANTIMSFQCRFNARPPSTLNIHWTYISSYLGNSNINGFKQFSNTNKKCVEIGKIGLGKCSFSISFFEVSIFQYQKYV